jgi:hypothetical protein
MVFLVGDPGEVVDVELDFIGLRTGATPEWIEQRSGFRTRGHAGPDAVVGGVGRTSDGPDPNGRDLIP